MSGLGDLTVGQGGVILSAELLHRAMPLHLLVAPDGQLQGAGPTMRKMIPRAARRLSDAFRLTRPIHAGGDLAALDHAARHELRVFLRMTTEPRLTLRGHAVALANGAFLINPGFGISLPDAVRDLGLTDADFAPSELAMELLFLHEANRAVMHELSRFNLRLDEAREAAELQAFTDPLTGLYNRRGLELALAVALRADKTAREQGKSGGFALAHLDLDLFKQVNDCFGHAAGDEVLQHVAKVLRAETRAGDTVARVGGDEFVLLLDGMTAPGALEGLARRIISGIETPIRVGDSECRVSASIGIAMSGQYVEPTAETMLTDADAALYQSKNSGRSRATLHGVNES